MSIDGFYICLCHQRYCGLFFIGAVVVMPWIAAFLGYCIGYIAHVIFKRNVSIQQSNIINYLIGLALVITFCGQWLIWMLYVIQDHVTTNPEIILIQTYSHLNQMYTLLTDPGLLVDILQEINAVGTWRIDDDEDLMLGKTKGITLAYFWLVELLLMAMFPFFVKLKSDKDNVLKNRFRNTK